MNCKPGDLAIVIHSPVKKYSHVTGRIVEVLYLAPEGVFELPNGNLQSPVNTEENGAYWVCRFLNPVEVGMADRGMFLVTFSPVPDVFLRPLRDSDGDDEMLRIAGLPNKQPEAA